jgi:hypothetical protein
VLLRQLHAQAAVGVAATPVLKLLS